MDDLRYPVGRFDGVPPRTPADRDAMIHSIAETPANLRQAVGGLSDTQLDTPYRPDGWTVRQVVHHVPDSHMNAYVRFKLAMTEESPTIKAYNEKLWATLPDAKTAPVALSLTLLERLHERWVIFLRNLSPDDFARTFIHPENGLMTLDKLLALYAWHGRHHTAHITSLRKRMNW